MAGGLSAVLVHHLRGLRLKFFAFRYNLVLVAAAGH